MNNVRVHHWNYHDGWRTIPSPVINSAYGFDREFDEDIKGWHCWVYCDDWDVFEEWMQNNMKYEYDCTRRFNSGDPMMTVFIREDEDATLFKLTWL
jgi:hypothetical protein